MSQSIVGVAEAPTLFQRARIITAFEDRLGRKLDGDEESLRASAAGAEVLQSVQAEHAAEYGPIPTLAQRERMVGAAQNLLREHREQEASRERAAAAARQEAERRQAEARRRDAVAVLEKEIRATRQGPAWLADAERQVLSDANRELTLEEREDVAQTVAGRLRADLAGRKETPVSA